MLQSAFVCDIPMFCKHRYFIHECGLAYMCVFVNMYTTPPFCVSLWSRFSVCRAPCCFFACVCVEGGAVVVCGCLSTSFCAILHLEAYIKGLCVRVCTRKQTYTHIHTHTRTYKDSAWGVYQRTFDIGLCVCECVCVCVCMFVCAYIQGLSYVRVWRCERAGVEAQKKIVPLVKKEPRKKSGLYVYIYIYIYIYV